MAMTALKLIVAVIVGLMLASCGGGEDTASSALESSLASVEARRPAQDPTLVGGPVSVANGTTPASGGLRSIGATSDGGYTVAWGSTGEQAHMQRYDDVGEKDGENALTGSAIPSGLFGNPTSLAVLTDGSVVMAYWRPVQDEPDRHAGAVFIQRFDASGAQILPETELDRDTPAPGCGNSCRFVGLQKVHALADGFAVEWSADTLRTSSVLVQRYDLQGQSVGRGGFTFVKSDGVSFMSHRITADARGGFVLLSEYEVTFTSQVWMSITHYDPQMRVQADFQKPLGQRLGRDTPPLPLVLPLEAGYALFLVDAGGAKRQMLDTAGNATGDAVPIPAFPVEARELSDGSFVAIWNDATRFTAQRFTGAGALLGQPVPIDIGVSSFQMASLLTEPGFALAWTAQGNVYTQRFVESGQTARKACLDAAKALRLKGRERKAFVDACLAVEASEVHIRSRAEALLQSIRDHVPAEPSLPS